MKEQKILSMQVVTCPMMQGSTRTLEACKECPHHKGVREIMPAGQNKTPERPEGLPASFQVLCALPQGIMVNPFLVEESTLEEIRIAAESVKGDVILEEAD